MFNQCRICLYGKIAETNNKLFLGLSGNTPEQLAGALTTYVALLSTLLQNPASANIIANLLLDTGLAMDTDFQE